MSHNYLLSIIIRPHRTRRRGLLLPTFCGMTALLCRCLFDVIVSCANTDEPIAVPFGVRTRGAKEPRIKWGPGHPAEGAILRGAAAMRTFVNIL